MPADRDLLERVLVDFLGPQADVHHLGTGGFACTFRVLANGGVTAYKVVDPGRSEVERVERELTALQRVSHPAVVRYMDHGVHRFEGVGYYWIQMEFVEGTSLAAELAGGVVFDTAEAMRLVRDLVAGAAAIWAEGTAHRDLSPNNIMLRHDSAPVIVDLGLARHIDDDSFTVLPTPGTPGWMSPEQVGASPTHGDWRSDQFVIGALGYLLLTNVRPFYAASLIDRWRAPATQVPQPIRAIDPDVPAAAADVLERMLQKQPHRRYLQVNELLADLDRAILTLETSTTADRALAGFMLNISQVKNFAENGFLSHLRPAATVIDIRAGSRVGEFVDAARSSGSVAVVDPVSHFRRSPVDARPARFSALPYGGGPVLTGFGDNDARNAWCRQVIETTVADAPDAVISPYFYAGESELNWLQETLACAEVTEGILGLDHPSVQPWLGVALHSSWLSNAASRDTLLTALTARRWGTLYLQLATSQPPLGPLADVGVLRGLRDLLTVMREAGTPVIAGKRASSGLLLLALGADGWSTGVSGNLMNMTPHPEDEQTGGRALDRIYVPSLLNLVSVDAFVLMRATNPDLVTLSSPQADELLDRNPALDSLSTEERILLIQHNLIAQAHQAQLLSDLPAGQRISRLREWVDAATVNYRTLPPTRLESEGPSFLSAWAEVLA